MTEPQELLAPVPYDPLVARRDVIAMMAALLAIHATEGLSEGTIEEHTAGLMPEHLDAAIDLLVGACVAAGISHMFWVALLDNDDAGTADVGSSIVDLPEVGTEPEYAPFGGDRLEMPPGEMDAGATSPAPDDIEPLPIPASLASAMEAILDKDRDRG
jgi:hypothetical protein